MCDPANPIAGGACPVKNTGPPSVTYPLIDAIKTPAQLGSGTQGSWQAIGKNVKAIDYYVKTLGSGPQYNGYGKRVVYDTGVKCNNMPGNAHRLADGTSAGAGGHGLVPRMIGGIAAFAPDDIVNMAKDSVPCRQMRVHYNTPAEIRAMNERATGGVPPQNRIKISNSSGVNYPLVDRLCREGRLRPCIEKPISTNDIKEGFATRYSSRQQTGELPLLTRLEPYLYAIVSLGILGGIGVMFMSKKGSR